jgi:hypothetical protein
MRFDIGVLPGAPLAAAAAFFAEVLPLIEHAMIEPLKQSDADPALAEGEPIAREALLLIFAPADHAHQGWRVALVQALAREHAPLRVNAVASNDGAAIAAAEAYLGAAPGVTGQYWPLDGTGAGGVLS